MWKSLKYYWQTNLAVLLGIIITTAVLTGALLVGDSVKGSLRELTLARLGKINYAMVTDHFVREQLATDTNSTPAILLTGNATFGQKRASGINITGIDSSFLKFFEPNGMESSLSKTGIYPPVVINQSLANELMVKAGEELILSFSKPTDIDRETVLGNRDAAEVSQRGRFLISAIIPDQDIGLFTLNANQHLPFVAFVPLDRFQQILNQSGKINALLSADEKLPDLRGHLQMQDLGLKLRKLNDSQFALESDEVVLKPAVETLANEVARSLNLKYFAVLTYLANQITYKDHLLPYSTIAAIHPPIPFQSMDGNSISEIGENEILLNEWAASDLAIRPGEDVTLQYFVIGPENRLLTKQSVFKLKAVIRQQDLAADPNLTPEFPGIQNAQHISDWSPPFPVNLNLIRPKDEEYWNQYRATPKGFINESTGKKLWSSRFGTSTSMRFLGADPDKFGSQFLANVDPAAWNLQFRAVKEEGLKASEGATDFAGLFIGFSLFLIVSALLLVLLLFRLGIEQRKREVGFLFAAGFRIRQIQKRFLSETILLVLAGAAIGLLVAKLYAAWIINSLESRWIAAVGSSFLSFYAEPISLISGFFIAVIVCLIVLYRSILSFSKRSVLELVKDSTTVLVEKRKRMPQILLWSGLIAAILFTAIAFFIENPALFFGAGAAFLLAAIAWFSLWLRSKKYPLRPEARARRTFAIRSATRNPSRTLFSTCLVACACFVIISVGANRRGAEENPLEKSSGTGGFSLAATTDIPVFDPPDLQQAPAPLKLFSFRVLPGDDASCLNLYQPQKPRILGVPETLIQRGGFRFQQTIRKTENPWSLLGQSSSNEIPAIGDYNSVRWILHKKLGDNIPVVDESGQTVQLKIVAMLQGSLLQSELLISEKNFITHFPSYGGKSYFLIESNLKDRDSISDYLESELRSYGFDAVKTEEKLAAYHAIENTYLSTFQTLGSLGLLLGTLGLGIVLIRNVLERRGELATLRAFGFERKQLGWFVLIESAFLLVVGILSGSISAAIAILPHLLSQSPELPVLSLGITLLTVFVVGMISSLAAIFVVLRIPLLPALKEL